MDCRGISTTDRHKWRRRALTHATWALLVTCFVLQPRFAHAQSNPVANPTTLQFTPSADHQTLLRYDLEILPANNPNPAGVLNLGKPPIEADGKVRVSLVTWHLTDMFPAGSYQARVTAVSSGGTSQSGLSNVFALAAPCTYSLGASGATLPATAGSGSVRLGRRWLQLDGVELGSVAHARFDERQRNGQRHGEFQRDGERPAGIEDRHPHHRRATVHRHPVRCVLVHDLAGDAFRHGSCCHRERTSR
jgi:hypothetical protein